MTFRLPKPCPSTNPASTADQQAELAASVLASPEFPRPLTSTEASSPHIQETSHRWEFWLRIYLALMACVLIAAATAKALSIRVQPALAVLPDPVVPALQSGTLQWVAVGAELVVAIVLIAGSNLRRNALCLMGLGFCFLSYRVGLAFAGGAACGCLGHSSVTGLSAESADRVGTWIIGAALSGSFGVLAYLRSRESRSLA